MSPETRYNIQQLININENKTNISFTIEQFRYRYRYEFRTTEPEKFKRDLTSYKTLNPDIIIFDETDDKPDIKHTIQHIPQKIIDLKYTIFPITAMIFFRLNEKMQPYDVAELLRLHVLDPTPEMPESTSIHDQDRRYRLKIKVKKSHEFEEKFNRFKNENSHLDIFVMYEYADLKSYIPYLGYIAIVIMSLPRINEVYELLKKILFFHP